MNRSVFWLLVASLALLIGFSVYLASKRIYQVDECTEIYVARTLAEGGPAKADLANIGLFQLPLSWLCRSPVRSVNLLRDARFLMVAIFWLNMVFLALATGERLLSRRGLVALVGAATLAPAWDYGFEIRHDNVLLTGLLLTWCLVRVRPGGLRSYFLTGAIAVAMQFVAFKAFVYTLPIALMVLAFPPPGYKAPRWKLALSWVLGALGMFLVVRLVYGMAGLWDAYMSGFRWTSGVSISHGYRFAPWSVLARLLGQTPLLLALVASALLGLAVELYRCRKTLLRAGSVSTMWEGNLPEALLLAAAFAAFLINPTPFPYNLVNLVPFAFLLAFRHASMLLKHHGDHAALVPVAAGVAIFVHLAPFAVATHRHLDWPNTRQEELMRLAEDLTDPVKDPIFDGIGMVPTRPIIDPRAFLHSLSIQSLLTGPGPHVRDLLAAHPAAVFIPNYRTDALAAEDHAFIREHYVALADDFWVLGKVLPPGGGTFEVGHPGRYRIASLPGADLSGTYPDSRKHVAIPGETGDFKPTLNDNILSNSLIELPVGTHRIECASNSQPAVVWVGPHLDRLPRLSPADHRMLFYNWY